MKCKVKFLIMGIASVLCLFASLPVENWGEERFKEILDSFSVGDVKDSLRVVRARQKDALKEFSWFLEGSGWSTN